VEWEEGQELVLEVALVSAVELAHQGLAMVVVVLALGLLGNHQWNCSWCSNLCCTSHHCHHLGNHRKWMHHPMHSNSNSLQQQSQPSQQAAQCAS
jgi:hypothetical protein